MSVARPKPKQLPQQIKTTTNYPMNQSELEANTVNRRQARENACNEVAIGLRGHIKNSKECFIRYPNTSKLVKKTRLRLVFSTHFSEFGYPDETLFLVFDILLENRSFTVR